MVTPAAGTVVLVPFPFSDLSQAKLRPAVVLADVGRGDWILCQITSNPYPGLFMKAKHVHGIPSLTFYNGTPNNHPIRSEPA